MSGIRTFLLESFIAFKILIVAELFVFLTTIFGSFIAAIGKQKTFAKIGGLGAIINIILNLILIPKFSLYGAAFATLATYALMFICMFIFVRQLNSKF
jgi:O-antigen/teichoic acid export membrane protein